MFVRENIASIIQANESTNKIILILNVYFANRINIKNQNTAAKSLSWYKYILYIYK
jgi:hypothetical protein